MDCDPCTSEIPRNSKKRKQPDGEGPSASMRPLMTNPIDNEYEELSEAELSEEDESSRALKRDEMEQIERAQEAATVSDIGGIKITPFNLEEELEEGEFDKAGNFVFKRRRNSHSGEDENDTWAESVDWGEVKRREEAALVAAKSNPKQVMTASTQETSETPRNKIECYRLMLRLMEPSEIVKKTIKRLGDSIPKRKPVNKNKRSSVEDAAVDKTCIEEMRRNLDLMIELAHQRLEEGDLDVYQKSYDELERAVRSAV